MAKGHHAHAMHHGGHRFRVFKIQNAISKIAQKSRLMMKNQKCKNASRRWAASDARMSAKTNERCRQV
jgi:hypothetical protein